MEITNIFFNIQIVVLEGKVDSVIMEMGSEDLL